MKKVFGAALLIFFALGIASTASAITATVDVKGGSEVLLPTGTGVTDGIVKVTVEKLTGESVWSWITDWFAGGTKKVEGRVYIQKGNDFFELDCTPKTMRYFILDPNEEANCNLDDSTLQQYFYGETFAGNPEPVKVKVISNDTEKARLQITINDDFLRKAMNKISSGSNKWLRLDFSSSLKDGLTFDMVKNSLTMYSDAGLTKQINLTQKKSVGNIVYIPAGDLGLTTASINKTIYFTISKDGQVGNSSITITNLDLSKDLDALPAGAN
ncbi:MAG: hypothetical protein Q7R70_04840 [Candidatus Diapherotrites archaeon]|nr:hypothetical protein [Candidatus Diapherotrites archaeon]